ncbi:hypothetical protein ES703_106859 [subsurface metagenome]
MCELEIAKEGYIFGYNDSIRGKVFDENNTGGWNIFDTAMFQKGYLMGYKDSSNEKDLVECIAIRMGRGEIL